MTTHPHSWQVPPLGPFMVDRHTAAGTDQPVMSWTSQCLMSPSSVMAQLNEQLGATQGGPRGRHRTALSKNNAEKSMFLLILLKRSHRPHLASEQELRKIQQMGGSSSLPFPQRYTQTGLFFSGKSVSQVRKDTSLEVPFSWDRHKHLTALQTGKAERSVCLEVQQQDWAFIITVIHHDQNEGTSLCCALRDTLPSNTERERDSCGSTTFTMVFKLLLETESARLTRESQCCSQQQCIEKTGGRTGKAQKTERRNLRSSDGPS